MSDFQPDPAKLTTGAVCPTVPEASWKLLLTGMLDYVSGRIEGEPLSSLLRQGLHVFMELPGYRGLALFLMEKDTFEFHHSMTFPKSNQQQMEKLYLDLVESGKVAWTLNSGHAFYTLSDSQWTTASHLLMLSLSVPTSTVGLVLILLDIAPEKFENFLLQLCLLHARQFAYVVINAILVQELREQKGILEQRIAARTQSLEQAKRELEANADQLKEAMEEAERTSRFKTNFMTNMSHEIRTPMNGILGMLEMTLESKLDPDQRNFVETAQKCAQSLLALINDILDLAKIEAGRMERHDAPFQLHQLISIIIDTTSHSAHQKKLELLCYAEEEVPDPLIGDHNRLRQILVNLTGNAIKFTDRGEVILRVECLNNQETKALLRFSVTDTGIGIHPGSLPKIFEVFMQGDDSLNRRYGGTGLGLPISRQLCRIMGGELLAESREGKGSRFWFDLEIQKQSNEDPTPAEILPAGALIIDDSFTAAGVLEKMLRKYGMQTTIVCGLEEALQVVRESGQRKETFPFLFLDLAMCLTDESFPAQLRSLIGSREIQVIGLSQPGRPDIHWTSLTPCCDRILSKPIKNEALHQTLFSATRIQQEPTTPRDRKAEQDLLGGLRILLVEDMEINRMVVTSMLKSLSIQIDTADNGLEALAALKKKNYHLVLMDIQMPEMDGYMATRKIRENQDWQNLIIVALSAHALTEEREKSLQVGMNDFLTKPIQKEKLIGCLVKWAQSLGTDSGKDRKNHTAPEAMSVPTIKPIAASLPIQEARNELRELPTIQVEDVLRRLEGNQQLLVELFALFDETLMEILAKIETALAVGDFAAITSLGHQLKGSASNLSATAIRQAALQIEQTSKQQDVAGVTTAIRLLRWEYSRFHSFRAEYRG